MRVMPVLMKSVSGHDTNIGTRDTARLVYFTLSS